MPTTLQEATGWSNLAVGWMIVIPMSLSLLAMLWVGHHSAKTGEKRWHGAAGMFVAAVGMLLGMFATSPAVAFRQPEPGRHRRVCAVRRLVVVPHDVLVRSGGGRSDRLHQFVRQRGRVRRTLPDGVSQGSHTDLCGRLVHPGPVPRRFRTARVDISPTSPH